MLEYRGHVVRGWPSWPASMHQSWSHRGGPQWCIAHTDDLGGRPTWMPRPRCWEVWRHPTGPRKPRIARCSDWRPEDPLWKVSLTNLGSGNCVVQKGGGWVHVLQCTLTPVLPLPLPGQWHDQCSSHSCTLCDYTYMYAYQHAITMLNAYRCGSMSGAPAGPSLCFRRSTYAK